MKQHMYSTVILGVASAIIHGVAAVSVSGAAEGFAEGVTGGGSATAVYPTTTDELVSYLGDSEARVIVLDQTLAFSFFFFWHSLLKSHH
jgi:pectin lyase